MATATARTYAVKSLVYTLQGEGVHAGRPAVFCRFAGCNLWDGGAARRGVGPCSAWCDTDFVGTDGPGGGRYEAEALANAVDALWPRRRVGRFVVLTGGEPALQADEALADRLHGRGVEIAVETNGTRRIPSGIDWVTVSPKAGTEIEQSWGDELKLVYPQPGLDPEHLLTLDFGHYLLSPMDGPEREANTRLALAYCLAHPPWRLSLQLHKTLGIP